MDELTPIYRVEHFLDTIVNGSANPYDPIYRIEKYLAKIAGEDVEVPTPIYRVEMYLAYLCGMDVTIPEPIYRIEFYLAKKCGMDVETPVPIYRIEYWLDEWANGGSGSLVTITGVSPLTLANAIAHSIHRLTQYGKVEQPYLPTPTASADILCNNGAIKVSPNLANMVEANVVVGKYINNSGVETADIANFFYAPYVPVTPGGTYTMATSSSIWYFSVMQYDSSKNFLRRSIWGATNTPVGTEKTFDVGADCAFIRFGSNMKKSAISLADVLAVNWMLTQTATAQDFCPYGEIYVGGTHPKKNLYNPASPWVTHTPIGFSGGSASWPNAEPETYPNSITYFMRVKPDTTYTYSCATVGDRFGVAGENSVVDPSDYTTASRLTFDSILVPLKSSGVGKTYSFTTGANTQMVAVYCALSTVPTDIQIEEGATATDYEAYTEIPYQPEVLTVGGVNLCNPALYTGDGWYISANNTVSSANSNGTLVFPCKPNTTYSWWHTDGKGGARAFELTTDTVTLGQAATWAVGNPAYNDAMTVRKYTTSANAKLLCVLFARVADQVGRTIDEQLADFMLVEGDIDAAFAYQPYHAPQTVTDVPMLLSVGDYADEAEIISGIKTGKVGIYVFTGEEAFTKGSAFYTTNTSFLPSKKGDITPICTHFKGISAFTTRVSDSLTMTVNGPSTNVYTGCVYFYADRSLYATADDFKAWLAAQYAAGTPVIVIYPLATATTEQTTPHALHTSNGTNVVEVTSNVDPVTLECEYMGVSE